MPRKGKSIKKDIIVIGDIEMGAGNLTDDFISDRALSKVILKFAKKRNTVDLILNGDTFDFLKCPYVQKEKHTYPNKITEEISINKLEQIYKAHRRVFQALKHFVSQAKNNLYLIIGNHDHDLFFPGVQKKLRTLLKGKHNIFFPLVYQQNSVHVEHGHQYDALNRVDLEDLFVTKGKKTYLNLPEASQGILFSLMGLKTKHHPFLERIKPISALLAHHLKLSKAIKRRSVLYFTRRMLGYSLHRIVSKKAKYPHELVKEALQRLKKHVDCAINIVPQFKRKRKQLKQYAVHVFGHVHHRYIEQHTDWVIIHADTWRDEYLFDIKSRKLLPK